MALRQNLEMAQQTILETVESTDAVERDGEPSNFEVPFFDTAWTARPT